MPWNFQYSVDEALIGVVSPTSLIRLYSTTLLAFTTAGNERGNESFQPLRKFLKTTGLPAYRFLLGNTVSRHCRVNPALFLLSYDSACAPALLLRDGARQASGKRSDASLP